MTKPELRPKYEEFIDAIREQTKDCNSLHYVLQAMKNVIEPQIKVMTKSQLVDALAEAIYCIYCTENLLNCKDVNIEHYRREHSKSQHELMLAPHKARRETASKAGLARHEKDPKQKVLQQIKSEFHQRPRIHFEKYGYGAHFVREMMEKYPIIESQKTIENLIRNLKKNIPQ